MDCTKIGNVSTLFLFVTVVTQRYEVNVMDEHVLRGNTAIIKCHIPSFVADYVFVASWLENEDSEIYPSNDYGTYCFHFQAV